MDTARLAQCIKQMLKTNYFLMGIVKSSSPLIFTISGIDFEESEIMINAEIKEKDATLKVSEIESHTGKLKYNNYFNVGDKALFLNNNNELVLLCKVV